MEPMRKIGNDTDQGKSRGLTRRRVLGSGSLGVLATIAGWTGMTATAYAAPVCCDLLYPPGSSKYCKGNGRGGFVCPSPRRFRAWYCCQGSRTYACAECTSATSCWTVSAIYCSAYWTVSPNSCTQNISPDKLVARMDPEDAARWKKNPWGTVTKEELERSSSRVVQVDTSQIYDH